MTAQRILVVLNIFILIALIAILGVLLRLPGPAEIAETQAVLTVMKEVEIFSTQAARITAIPTRTPVPIATFDENLPPWTATP